MCYIIILVCVLSFDLFDNVSISFAVMTDLKTCQSSFFTGLKFQSCIIYLVYCIIGVCIVIFGFRVVCGSIYLILLNSTEGFTHKYYQHGQVLTLTPTPSCLWHLVRKSVNKTSYFYAILFVQHPSCGGRNSFSIHTNVCDSVQTVIKEKYM